MSEACQRQGEAIAKAAFMLMLGGVLFPMLIGLAVLLPGLTLPQTTADLVFLLGVGFSLLAEVVAFVLGAMCREQPFGKAAMIGAGAVIVLGGLALASVMGIGGVAVAPAP
jgi:hypothetical protein